MTAYAPFIGFTFAALLAAGTGGLACRGASPSAEGVTWTHIAEIAALQGGFPTRIDAVTVSAGGRIQVSRETDRDEILELRELRADPAPLFQELGRIAATMPPSPRSREDEGGVVREHFPPRLRLAIGGTGKSATLWEGPAGEAPPSVTRAVALVRELAARAQAVGSPPHGVYVRAGLLPARVARELRREGLVRSGEPGELSPSLEACLAEPFRLVPVRSGDNPFTPFLTRHQPGRTALELSVGAAVYQIRSLVYEASAP